MPVWLYDSSNWSNPKTAYHPTKHDEIRNNILTFLERNYDELSD